MAQMHACHQAALDRNIEGECVVIKDRHLKDAADAHPSAEVPPSLLTRLQSRTPQAKAGIEYEKGI